MRQTRPTNRPPRSARSRGFTLTELLVSISVIILIIGITFPVISAIKSGSRIEAGLNTVGMTADVARQWVAPSAWDADQSDKVQNEQYSGCAALYGPAGEVRIITNYRNALDRSGRYLEDIAPFNVNGYWDLRGVDYISIPNGVGVAGIYRFGPGANDVRFLAPPFAVAFNEKGQMYFGDRSGRIYYDSNGDSTYESTGRPNNYDPSQWDGQDGATNEKINEQTLVHDLAPFEGIECVPGVVIFDSEDFEGAGFSFAGGGSVDLTSPAGQWLQENGQTLFFSPNTGIALRDEAE